MRKSIQELEQEYELEFSKIVQAIKGQKAKIVLLQFPDGLKPHATVIVDELENRAKREEIKCSFLIWLGSCFGACDVPLQVKHTKPKIDLIIQFGHSAWPYKNKEIQVLK